MRQRSWIWLTGLVIAVTLAWGAYQNYQGMCLREMQRIPDEEKIRLAIADVLSRFPPAVVKKATETQGVYELVKPDHVVRYSSIQQFRERNENCCTILSRASIDARTPNLLERVTGVIQGWIEVRYRVDVSNNVALPGVILAQEIIPISNCGISQRWWSETETNWVTVLYHFFRGDF